MTEKAHQTAKLHRIQIARGAWLEDAKRIEYDVFHTHGYVPTRQSRRLQEYQSFDSQSVFIVATDENDSVIGVLRVIVGPPFKTLLDLETEIGWLQTLTNEPSLEIGTLAVDDNVGDKTDVMLGLIAFAYNWSGRAVVRHWWLATLDSRLIRVLSSKLGCKITRMGPQVDYMGSPCTPVVFDLSEHGESSWNKVLHPYQKHFQGASVAAPLPAGGGGRWRSVECSVLMPMDATPKHATQWKPAMRSSTNSLCNLAWTNRLRPLYFERTARSIPTRQVSAPGWQLCSQGFNFTRFQESDLFQ